MDSKLRKSLENNLRDLKNFQEFIFGLGHTFWHCDSVDEDKKMPFYYYQRNRRVNMSTCSHCQQLMDNRLKIRKIERLLGIPLTPLKTEYSDEKHVKRMTVKNSSEHNPNYYYIS